MSDVVPQIPTLEQYPVTGDSGAVTVQAGGLIDTSRLLSGQSQQVTAMSAELAPNWSGEAASGYQSLSANVAGAFGRAATAIAGAAQLMLRYASELERLQREAQAAKLQSEHWHQEVTTWTGRVTDAQTAVARAQSDLTTAQGQYAAAAAQGPKAAAAAAQANGALTRARGALHTAQHDLTRARQQLAHAREQFTHWQDRARRIQVDATSEGERVSAALLLITIVPPALPGAPDYPVLEPTPRILVNDDPGNEQGGGKGEPGDGGKEDGSGKTEQGEGKADGGPPKVIEVGPDGKIVHDPPDTKTGIGDRKQEELKAAGRLDHPQPRAPLWVTLLNLWSHIFHGPGGRGG